MKYDKAVDMIAEQQLRLNDGLVSIGFDMRRLSQTLVAIAACLANPELSINFTVKDKSAVNETLLRKTAVNAKKKLNCSAMKLV